MLGGLLFAFFLLVSVTNVSVAQQAMKLDSAKLVGSWKVDLRPTPDAPPSYAKFEIKKVEGNTLTGTFYDSEIKNGCININWDAIYFAFTTADGFGGAYNTSGKIVGDRLEGTTHAVDRKFLSVWKAEREKQAIGFIHVPSNNRVQPTVNSVASTR